MGTDKALHARNASEKIIKSFFQIYGSVELDMATGNTQRTL